MQLVNRRSLAGLLPSLLGYQTPQGNQCLSLPHAKQMIRRHCPIDFQRAVQESHTLLYRGESVFCPTILNSPPDLLDPETYGGDADAIRFFECLEDRFRNNPIRPSTGHIGIAKRSDAAVWGPPCSVWPLGIPFAYMWPRESDLFYPGGRCDNQFVVDSGLVEAFHLQREVMFASRSFLVIPELYEKEIWTIFENK